MPVLSLKAASEMRDFWRPVFSVLRWQGAWSLQAVHILSLEFPWSLSIIDQTVWSTTIGNSAFFLHRRWDRATYFRFGRVFLRASGSKLTQNSKQILIWNLWFSLGFTSIPHEMAHQAAKDGLGWVKNSNPFKMICNQQVAHLANLCNFVNLWLLSLFCLLFNTVMLFMSYLKINV